MSRITAERREELKRYFENPTITVRSCFYISNPCKIPPYLSRGNVIEPIIKKTYRTRKLTLEQFKEYMVKLGKKDVVGFSAVYAQLENSLKHKKMFDTLEELHGLIFLLKWEGFGHETNLLECPGFGNEKNELTAKCMDLLKEAYVAVYEHHGLLNDLELEFGGKRRRPRTVQSSTREQKVAPKVIFGV